MLFLMLVISVLYENTAFEVNRENILMKNVNYKDDYFTLKRPIYTLSIPDMFLNVSTVQERKRKVSRKFQPESTGDLVSCDDINKSWQQVQTKIKCKPRDVIVDLAAPEGVQLIQNKAVIKKCDGVCHGAKSCLPVQQKDIQIPVRVLLPNTNECSYLTVKEDVKCTCKCAEEKTCLANQRFDKETCKCVCKDKAMKQACLRKRNVTFVWNEDKCSCVCLKKYCTSGTKWNEILCRCE